MLKTGAIVLAAAIAVPAAAEEARQLAQVLQENRELLKNYSWKQRTEITVDGKTKSTQLFQVRYDFDGNLEKTPIGGVQEPKKVRGPVRKRMAKKKKNQAKEDMAELKQLIESYTHLTPDRIHQLFAGASVWKGQGAQSGLTRIQAKNVLRTGDTMDVWLDSKSRKPRKFEILTSKEGEPVEVLAEFKDLTNGPSFPARIVVKTEKKEKKTVIETENFDYIRQGG